MAEQNPPDSSNLTAKPTESEAASVKDRIAAIRKHAGAGTESGELGNELLEDVAGGVVDPVDHTDNHTDHSSGS